MLPFATAQMSFFKNLQFQIFFGKKGKMCLTNGFDGGSIQNVPPKWRVPCKLNNETNEKHRKVALKDAT